jgi:hypothetical protein
MFFLDARTSKTVDSAARNARHPVCGGTVLVVDRNAD